VDTAEVGNVTKIGAAQEGGVLASIVIESDLGLIELEIVTTANAQFVFPYECEPISIPNTLTGASRTVTVYGTINAGAVPNNDDIFIEAERRTRSRAEPPSHRTPRPGTAAAVAWDGRRSSSP
jgi:hypothetical protein